MRTDGVFRLILNQTLGKAFRVEQRERYLNLVFLGSVHLAKVRPPGLVAPILLGIDPLTTGRAVDDGSLACKSRRTSSRRYWTGASSTSRTRTTSTRRNRSAVRHSRPLVCASRSPSACICHSFFHPRSLSAPETLRSVRYLLARP